MTASRRDQHFGTVPCAGCGVPIDKRGNRKRCGPCADAARSATLATKKRRRDKRRRAVRLMQAKA